MNIVSTIKCLRDESGAGINQGANTTASMVSVLTPPDSNIPSVHFITATPNPKRSVFKPFIFTKTLLDNFPAYSVSPPDGGDRKHKLYLAHERACATFEAGGEKAEQLAAIMISLEEEAIMGIDGVLQGESVTDSEIKELFLDCVETEIKFYNWWWLSN